MHFTLPKCNLKFFTQRVSKAARNTSCHGVGHIANSIRKSVKIYWTIWIIFSLGAMFYFLITRLHDYINSGTVASFSSRAVSSLKLPGVTFCSKNSFEETEFLGLVYIFKQAIKKRLQNFKYKNVTNAENELPNTNMMHFLIDFLHHKVEKKRYNFENGKSLFLFEEKSPYTEIFLKEAWNTKSGSGDFIKHNWAEYIDIGLSERGPGYEFYQSNCDLIYGKSDTPGWSGNTLNDTWWWLVYALDGPFKCNNVYAASLNIALQANYYLNTQIGSYINEATLNSNLRTYICETFWKFDLATIADKCKYLIYNIFVSSDEAYFKLTSDDGLDALASEIAFEFIYSDDHGENGDGKNIDNIFDGYGQFFKMIVEGIDFNEFFEEVRGYYENRQVGIGREVLKLARSKRWYSSWWSSSPSEETEVDTTMVSVVNVTMSMAVTEEAASKSNTTDMVQTTTVETTTTTEATETTTIGQVDQPKHTLFKHTSKLFNNIFKQSLIANFKSYKMNLITNKNSARSVQPNFMEIIEQEELMKKWYYFEYDLTETSKSLRTIDEIDNFSVSKNQNIYNHKFLPEHNILAVYFNDKLYKSSDVFTPIACAETDHCITLKIKKEFQNKFPDFAKEFGQQTSSGSDKNGLTILLFTGYLDLNLDFISELPKYELHIGNSLTIGQNSGDNIPPPIPIVNGQTISVALKENLISKNEDYSSCSDEQSDSIELCMEKCYLREIFDSENCKCSPFYGIEYLYEYYVNSTTKSTKLSFADFSNQYECKLKTLENINCFIQINQIKSKLSEQSCQCYQPCNSISYEAKTIISSSNILGDYKQILLKTKYEDSLELTLEALRAQAKGNTSTRRTKREISINRKISQTILNSKTYSSVTTHYNYLTNILKAHSMKTATRLEDLLIDKNIIAKGISTVKIYFDDLVVYENIEKAADKPAGVVSDLGGQFGLWMGISMVSIMEIFLFCGLACVRGKGDHARGAVTPEVESDSTSCTDLDSLNKVKIDVS